MVASNYLLFTNSTIHKSLCLQLKWFLCFKLETKSLSLKWISNRYPDLPKFGPGKERKQERRRNKRGINEKNVFICFFDHLSFQSYWVLLTVGDCLAPFNLIQFKNVLFQLLLSRATYVMNNERGSIYSDQFF